MLITDQVRASSLTQLNYLTPSVLTRLTLSRFKTRVKSQMNRFLQSQQCDRALRDTHRVEQREGTRYLIRIEHVADDCATTARITDENRLASKIISCRDLVDIARALSRPFDVDQFIEKLAPVSSSR
jgi:hypothetical protein